MLTTLPMMTVSRVRMTQQNAVHQTCPQKPSWHGEEQARAFTCRGGGYSLRQKVVPTSAWVREGQVLPLTRIVSACGPSRPSPARHVLRRAVCHGVHRSEACSVLLGRSSHPMPQCLGCRARIPARRHGGDMSRAQNTSMNGFHDAHVILKSRHKPRSSELLGGWR